MPPSCLSRAHSHFSWRAADRPFLGDAVGALGEDIEFAILGQEFDLHTRPGVVPGLIDKRLLQPGQPPLRGTDQVLHWRVGGAHLGQHRLGRHAAVHQPDPSRFAVLPLDTIEETTQRRVVLGVARQYFIGQRQPFGRHHQRDDHLHAVAAVVARIAEAALVAFQKRRVALEIEMLWGERRGNGTIVAAYKLTGVPHATGQ
jgi:hypothetical protein